MKMFFSQQLIRFLNSDILQVIGYFILVLIMFNLSAIIDLVFHPEIPYLDDEHIIVGGITGSISAILFGLLMAFVRKLNRALRQIKQLEHFLSICANCQKVRKPGADPKQMDSWQKLVPYIMANTDIRFSHGLCPDCANQLYPELALHKN